MSHTRHTRHTDQAAANLLVRALHAVLAGALNKSDTVASVRAAHGRRCAASRSVMMELTLDGVVDGRGKRSVWALYLQVLRELAQHAGHADILREQVLASRTS